MSCNDRERILNAAEASRCGTRLRSRMIRGWYARPQSSRPRVNAGCGIRVCARRPLSSRGDAPEDRTAARTLIIELSIGRAKVRGAVPTRSRFVKL